MVARYYDFLGPTAAAVDPHHHLEPEARLSLSHFLFLVLYVLGHGLSCSSRQQCCIGCKETRHHIEFLHGHGQCSSLNKLII